MASKPAGNDTAAGFTVLVDNRTEDAAVSALGLSTAGTSPVEELQKFAVAALKGEGLSNGLVEILLVSHTEMVALNEQHMGVANATDVLAFPIEGPEVANRNGSSGYAATLAASETSPDQITYLGDIVLCPEYIEQQARNAGAETRTEVALLVVHGILHILGHDHAETVEAELMRRQEKLHLETLGLEHPLRQGLDLLGYDKAEQASDGID